MLFGRVLAALIILGSFGLFLVWKGITDDVTRSIDGKRVIPKWVFIIGGLGALAVSVFYLIFLF